MEEDVEGSDEDLEGEADFNLVEELEEILARAGFLPGSVSHLSHAIMGLLSETGRPPRTQEREGVRGHKVMGRTKPLDEEDEEEERRREEEKRVERLQKLIAASNPKATGRSSAAKAPTGRTGDIEEGGSSSARGAPRRTMGATARGGASNATGRGELYTASPTSTKGGGGPSPRNNVYREGAPPSARGGQKSTRSAV